MRQRHYRGRLAPSPTGYLHLGHARTFWIAAERARQAGGELLLRNDDLDPSRSWEEFALAQQEDLRWLGLRWKEPMISQSQRLPLYQAAFDQLKAAGVVYPCWCSRKDLAGAARAPHEADEQEERVYPGTCRPENLRSQGDPAGGRAGGEAAWRFQVSDGEALEFVDGALGPQRAVAGTDFGDFVVWRKNGTPSYQMACAVDDGDMAITEVVRGADLVRSTIRQLLVLRALGLPEPAYYHCALWRDAQGERLAKRHDALSLRALRAQGLSPEAIISQFEL
jgi:glutamyl/glutaminyl-tRNA synthetase